MSKYGRSSDFDDFIRNKEREEEIHKFEFRLDERQKEYIKARALIDKTEGDKISELIFALEASERREKRLIKNMDHEVDKNMDLSKNINVYEKKYGKLIECEKCDGTGRKKSYYGGNNVCSNCDGSGLKAPITEREQEILKVEKAISKELRDGRKKKVLCEFTIQDEMAIFSGIVKPKIKSKKKKNGK